MRKNKNDDYMESDCVKQQKNTLEYWEFDYMERQK